MSCGRYPSRRWRGLLVLLTIHALSGMALAQSCLAESEPNDAPGTATELETARCFEGTLPADDQDAFTWRPHGDEAFTRWRIRIEGIEGQLTKIDLFDVTFAEDGEGVLATDGLFSHGTRDGREAVSDPFMVADGRYTLGISKSGGRGDYRVVLEPVEELAGTHELEPADVTGAFGLRGTLGDEADEVSWTLTEQDAERRWRLAAETALGSELPVRLLDAQDALVTEAAARGAEPLALNDLALEPGRYRLVLGPGADGASYALDATPASPLHDLGEREPNDAPDQANPLPVDEVTDGSLREGDVDHFRFEVDETLAQGLFDLVIDTDVDVAVTLSSPEGATLQERRGHGGALRSLRLDEGAYGLKLVGHGEGDYALSFRARGSPQAGVEEEPNDTAAGAYPLDDTLTVRGALGFADVDLYRFDIGGEGATYRVQVLAREAGVARVSVLDAAGNTVRDLQVPDGERRIRLEDVALAPGEYLMRLEGQGAEYAVRFLDLGALAERPPELEASTDGDEEPLEVTTVEEDAGAATEPGGEAAVAESSDRPARAQDMPSAPGGCRSPLDRLEPEPGVASTASYADAGAYACGRAVNLDITEERLQLDEEAAAFRFIWVAASQRGTVVKIDTDTGEILGEYWTAPVYDAERPSQNPSRSVVDRDGNAWIGNRDDELDGRGSVVKVGLLENGQCEDRDGDGRITTSQGLGDVLPWTNQGNADRGGGVATAEDECVLEYVRVNATGVRHLSVNGDNDLWVSGTGDHDYDLIDGETAEIVRTESAFACGGYGGLIDREGIVWSARPLLRWDPSDPLTRETVVCDHGWTYGLGLGPDDHVWASDFGHEVCRLTRKGEVDVCYDAGDDVNQSRGVAVTDDGHVWVVHSHGNAVTRFEPDGAIVKRIAVGGRPTGIAVDARGKVWVTNLGTSNAMRIDPATNEVDLTVGLGTRGDPDELPFYDHARPYTYSDMTGQLVFGPPESGSWSVTLRGPSFRTRWEEVRFDADAPDGSEVTVRASGAEGAPRGGARAIRSGEPLGVEAPYLTLTVSMERAPDGTSPSFGALEVAFTPLPLEPGSIAVEARPELVASSNAIGVILDASGSMNQLLEGRASRMDAAKEVLTQLADSAFPSGVPLSLRVFGHLEPNSCHTSLELPLAPFEPEAFKAAVAGFEPKLLSGTPLGESIAAAGQDLTDATGRKMVVLVTDGEESCDGDPAAAIRALREQGIETVNIVGFALENEAFKERLRDWAQLGRGRYADAASGEELSRALHEILQPEFLVLDAEGEEVGRGRVNRGAVEVPSGVYSVRVLSTPEKRIDGVRVIERHVDLAVALREEAAR